MTEASRKMLTTLVLLMAFAVPAIDSACLCPAVDKATEYCGVELNSLVSGNQCPKKMYFCASNNANKDAALLVDCPEGKDCDQKVMMVRNACLTDVVCKCPKKAKAGTMYCGHELEGKDCASNITFSCPYFAMLFKPSPVNVCNPDQICRRGICLPASSAQNATAAATA